MSDSHGKGAGVRERSGEASLSGRPRPSRCADDTRVAAQRQRPGVAAPQRPPLPTTAAAPLPSSSSGPPQRTHSPVFWGAVERAPLYAGPLGEVVGEVAAGAVLLEAARHRDVFGGLWIGSRCADGTLGWIAHSEPGKEAEGEALWQRVYDSRAPPAAAPLPADGHAGLPESETSPRSAVPSLSCADVSATVAAHYLFDDVALYAHYWDSVHPHEDVAARDWNWEYQEASERHWLLPRTPGAAPPAGSAGTAAECEPVTVHAVIAAFEASVKSAVVRICKEAVCPPAGRRIVAHPRLPDRVYYHDGILLRRCVDGADGALGGDEAAMKCGHAIYRNHALLAAVAQQHMLHVPLFAYCVFGGFAFLCSTIPPYDAANLVAADGSTLPRVGDAQHTHPVLPTPPPLVTELTRSLGEALRFDDGRLPREWRVYAGRDRRLYISQSHRLLPPVLPLRRTERATAATPASPTQSASSGAASLFAHMLCEHVRPDLFLRWPSSWPANECVGRPHTAPGATAPDAQGSAAPLSPSYAAGEWIRADGITTVAGTLGLQLPVAVGVPQVPVEQCSVCDGTMDADEVRWVVCTNPHKCCLACMHCYARLVLGHAAATAAEGREAPTDPLALTFPHTPRCGAAPRRAGSFLLEPSVSQLMHARGVNLRYLAYVLHRLPRSTRSAVEHWCHVELVARAAKHLLRQDLRGAATPADARVACEAFLLALLQPTGPVSERFWRTRIGPAVQSRFPGACEPFQLSVHALRLLAERVTALVGVTLSESSLSSLEHLSTCAHASPGDRRSSGGGHGSDTTDAFIEVAHIIPTTHVFACPAHGAAIGAAAEGAQTLLLQRLERLLLFWIGHSPRGADDAKQPFYLEEGQLLQLHAHPRKDAAAVLGAGG
ncbi:Translation initiation factor eIF3 subunit 135 [Novymonas esmeraldas]|uniref:Translation initiation factor eIF3 subunit 135 n=1 Tax=Novymonas esmeraldas TaxID=1808958 RepID=A0AAW0F119_9TRYP